MAAGRAFAGLILAALAVLGAEVAAREPVSGPAPEWVVSDDGSEVLRPDAGIAWSRCVEGMRWDGRRCVGSARPMDHAEAMAAAAARRQADGKGWRLPTALQLQRLSRGSAQRPGLDDTLFPAAPADWHWTSTAKLDTAPVNPYNYGNIRQGLNNDNVNRIAFLHGSAVHTGNGSTSGGVPRKRALLVRLVRRLEARP